MPTGSKAAEAVSREARIWSGVAEAWSTDRHAEVVRDLAPDEAAVVGFFDPREDLEGRARFWGYEFTAYDLSDLCRFGSALAQAEAEAWMDDEPHIATRAYADRRFLLGDRLLHWAIPWLDAAGRCYPDERDKADAAVEALLEIGEHHRPAPAVVSGTEGLFVPGEDSYGPVGVAVSPGYLLSVWSGRVVMRATIGSILGKPVTKRVIPDEWLVNRDNRSVLATMYQVMVPRWERMASEHPGSARLWLDLATRAGRTADLLH